MFLYGEEAKSMAKCYPTQQMKDNWGQHPGKPDVHLLFFHPSAYHVIPKIRIFATDHKHVL